MLSSCRTDAYVALELEQLACDKSALLDYMLRYFRQITHGKLAQVHY